MKVNEYVPNNVGSSCFSEYLDVSVVCCTERSASSKFVQKEFLATLFLNFGDIS